MQKQERSGFAGINQVEAHGRLGLVCEVWQGHTLGFQPAQG